MIRKICWVIALLAAVTFSQAQSSDTLIRVESVESMEDTTESSAFIDVEGLEFTDGSDSSVEEVDTVAVEGEQSLSMSVMESDVQDSSLWGIFIAGLLGGFAAFFMPCIFPMVPLTVSFFTKRSGSHAQGLSQALLYGLFIIVIYVALGMLVTIAFGSDALNELSTNGVFNFVFFVILVVFAASFFGAFE